MSDILGRFNLAEPQFSLQILACMVIVWMAVLVCALSSINSRNWTQRQRIFWLVIVCGIPFLGVLFYLPFSIRLENYPHLNMLKKEMR